MGELLGPLHEESYAHVDEVKADSYGFGGLTQERRYIAGQLEAVRQQEAAWSIAFSSEVDTRARSCDAGSREENASNKKLLRWLFPAGALLPRRTLLQMPAGA